jgi:hypothetical protein
MRTKTRRKPTKRRSLPAPPVAAPPADADALPHWLPTGDRWNDLPEAVRLAVPRLVLPAYRQFVLDAPDELQRSIGLTLVHLLWLELCDQARLTEVVANPTCLAAVLNNPEQMIDRHLNLVAAKSQTSELLVKLRLVTEALARSPAPSLPGGQTFLSVPSVPSVPSISSVPSLPSVPSPTPSVLNDDA